MNNFSMGQTVYFYSHTLKRWQTAIVAEVKAPYVWVEYLQNKIPLNTNRVLSPYQYDILKANGALK